MNFWSKLTSAKFSLVFGLFFVGGCLCLLFDFYVLVIPPACVVLYSLFLWTAQNRYAISLSAETRDSPYFLGFLFTLAALLLIFYNLPQADGGLNETFIPVVVPQIGTALLTTIFGLMARHFIIAHSPSIREEESVWKLATDELKENASAYREAQVKLLSLVDSFIESHKDLIAEEEEASKEHIKFLSESNRSLSNFQDNYIGEIDQIIGSFNRINEQLSNFANNDIPEFHRSLRDETTLGIQKLNNEFVRKISTAYTKMTKSIESIDPQVDALIDAYAQSFEKLPQFNEAFLKQSHDGLEQMHNRFIDSIKTKTSSLETSLTEVNSRVEQLSASFQACDSGAIEHSINKIGKELVTIKDTLHYLHLSISKSTDNINSNLTLFTENSRNRIDLFSNEVEQIDKLLDSFIEVTKKRIAA